MSTSCNVCVLQEGIKEIIQDGRIKQGHKSIGLG